MVKEGPRFSSKLFEGGYWSLPTDLGLVTPAENAFAKRLKRSGWDEDDSYSLQVSFREALINAMKHGNKNDPKKKVQIDVKVSRERVSVQIRDEGAGFKRSEVPDPTSPEGILRNSGRGLLMIDGSFDLVTRNEKGNEVIMTKERKD